MGEFGLGQIVGSWDSSFGKAKIKVKKEIGIKKGYQTKEEAEKAVVKSGTQGVITRETDGKFHAYSIDDGAYLDNLNFGENITSKVKFVVDFVGSDNKSISDGMPLAKVKDVSGVISSSADIPVSLPPDRIHFRTNTDTFTEKRYFSVRNGRIWVKPNPDTGVEGKWRALNGTGLPENKEDKKFTLPDKIVQISAETDAGHIIAVSDKGTIYDLFRGEWTDKWGLPSTRGIKMPGNIDWSISRRDKDSTFTDIAGHVHPSSVGVTTLYLLSPDGKTINYGDAWLPDFNNPIYGPERGTFIADSMASAGSTLFVMNKYGDMYTRIADFDTEGYDPLLHIKYTYDPDSPAWKRVLPGEGWIKQDKIDGKITNKLTVVQTGMDSHDREIRVEGVDKNGQGGYYAKPVYEGEWKFRPTNSKVSGPFIDNRSEDCVKLTQGNRRDVDLKGTFKAKWFFDSISIKADLKQFNVDNSPATLSFELDGKSYDCKLHLRPFYFDGLVLATLELPDELLKAKTPEASKLVKDGLDNEKYISLRVKEEGNTVRIHNTFDRVDMEFKRP